MKLLLVFLLITCVGLQYRFWVGDGSMAHVSRLKRDINEQQLENDRLSARNAILAEQVKALKNGTFAIEERAREDMGMVKHDETFFLIVDETTSTP